MRISDWSSDVCSSDLILEDLRWLGLRWDGDAVFQSERLPIYNAALEKLKDQGLAYPCFCTRAGIAAGIAASLSAPHGSGGPLYPGTSRKLDGADRSVPLAWAPPGWGIDQAKAAEHGSAPLRGRVGRDWSTRGV